MPLQDSRPTVPSRLTFRLTDEPARLRGWRLANFKAFGAEPQSVPLAPLTLIFGPNSAGKSSVLHSLLFTHESVRTGEADVHTPALAEGTVDLGGFRQLTFRQRTDENSVALDFDVAPDDLNELFAETVGEADDIKVKQVTVGLVIAIVPDNNDDHRAGRPALRRFDLRLDGRPFCQIGRDADGALSLRSVDLQHPFMIKLQQAYMDLLRGSTARPGDLAKRVSEIMDATVKRTIFDFDDHGLLPDGALLGAREEPEREYSHTDPDGLTDPEHIADFEAEEREQTEARLSRKSPSGSLHHSDPDFAAIGVLMNRFSELMGLIVAEATYPLREALEKLTYLGPLRSFPDRDFTLTQQRDPPGIPAADLRGMSWRVVPMCAPK